jgi:hypothetical protein
MPQARLPSETLLEVSDASASNSYDVDVREPEISSPIGAQGDFRPRCVAHKALCGKTRGSLDPDHWKHHIRRLVVVVELRVAVCALLNQWVRDKALPLQEASLIMGLLSIAGT